MIAQFVEGTLNVLKHHGILPGPMGRTGKDVDVFVGNSAVPVLATAAGFVEHLVKLHDKVEVGQKVAIQRNSFGETVAEYISPVQGEISGLRSDVTSEAGNPPTFILFHKAATDGPEVYPEWGWSGPFPSGKTSTRSGGYHRGWVRSTPPSGIPTASGQHTDCG